MCAGMGFHTTIHVTITPSTDVFQSYRAREIRYYTLEPRACRERGQVVEAQAVLHNDALEREASPNAAHTYS